MHRTLTALIVASLASGTLLLLATVTLDAWYWQQSNESQALQTSTSGVHTAVVENPYQLEESLSTHFKLFIGCFAVVTFWAVFVVLPSLLASRRFFTGPRVSLITAALVVCVLSGIAFAQMHGVTLYVSPAITFSAGGAIGLVSILLLAKLLPPNTSLERTREG